ncbi:MAG: hypothetical protein ABH950_09910 [Candidatus Altiarchaeota archaeon]
MNSRKNKKSEKLQIRIVKSNHYLQACIKVLDYAESQGYRGFSKFDALNSPYVKALTLGNKWLRGGAVLFVNVFPVNLRPIIGVKKSVNAKSISLFAQSYLDVFKITGDERYLQKGRYCLDWLLKNPSKGYSGLSWGYNFDWQSRLFYAPKYTPNCVVTVFGGEALVRAYEETGDKSYLDQAQESSKFLLHDLPVIYEDEESKCTSYVPWKVSSIVLNINALVSAFLAKLAKHTNGEDYGIEAKKLMRYVLNNKTDYNAWYYTFPPGDSHIRHDNYHTGGILDALLEYMQYTGEYNEERTYLKGLKYYRENLFNEDGAPKWMNDKSHPYDIHGAAQGIITFSKAASIQKEFGDFAHKIADWTLENLYNEREGYFYYQQGKYFKHKFSLMRWCNAWMSRALSELLLNEKNE